MEFDHVPVSLPVPYPFLAFLSDLLLSFASRRSQTDLALRCMFPTYSDWDIIDTPRGRMKHSFRWKTGYGALAVVIISGLWAKMVGVNFLKVIAEVRAMLLTVLNDRAVKVPTE